MDREAWWVNSPWCCRVGHTGARRQEVCNAKINAQQSEMYSALNTFYSYLIYSNYLHQCIFFFFGQLQATTREEYDIEIEGAQNKSPQNVPLWQVDYFEPKTIKAQKSQEEFLTSCLIA